MVSTTRIGKDGKRMVLVPDGWFWMGTRQADVIEWNKRFVWNPKWFVDEMPQHRVYLDAYYIDETPVTNAEYQRFLDANPNRRAQFQRDVASQKITRGWENFPVVLVPWESAQAYALWAGKRLPTEAEWEKAARGENGQSFPWGNLPEAKRCNSLEEENGQPVSVVHYAPQGNSPYGVMDMAGNIWEWCADFYAEDYYSKSPDHNPPGAAASDWRVIRGGAWDLALDYARRANRDFIVPETAGYVSVGFRCAMQA